MTPEEFRRLALSLEGTSEGAHMGHADFRVNGRIFATLGHPHARFAMVGLTPDEQAMRVETAPESFTPVPGGWGLKGSTRVILATADAAAVRGALAVAWRLQKDKPPTRPRKVEAAG